MNKTLYKQADSRWGSKPYPVKSSSFAGNGCGCVACVHCIIEQDKYKDYTPESIRPWMVKQGFAVTNQGTTWSGIPATLMHYGFSKVVHVGISDPMSKAWTELNKGNRIGIILFKSGKAPNGTVGTLIDSCENRNDAESKYHNVLAAAAISQLPLHCALLHFPQL